MMDELEKEERRLKALGKYSATVALEADEKLKYTPLLSSLFKLEDEIRKPTYEVTLAVEIPPKVEDDDSSSRR
jgi:hypothetical protein